MAQQFTLIDSNQSLTLTSTSNEVTIPFSKNDTLISNTLNAHACLAIITTLAVSTGAIEIGIYKGVTSTASNKIGRIRIGTNRFAAGNTVMGEAIATPAWSSSTTAYDTASEPVTGGFDDTTAPIAKVDTAAAGGSAAGVAKVLFAVAIREGEFYNSGNP